MAVIKTSGGKVVATSGGRVSVGNCGTGAGGFKAGNRCAGGGDGSVRTAATRTSGDWEGSAKRAFRHATKGMTAQGLSDADVVRISAAVKDATYRMTTGAADAFVRGASSVRYFANADALTQFLAASDPATKAMIDERAKIGRKARIGGAFTPSTGELYYGGASGDLTDAGVFAHEAFHAIDQDRISSTKEWTDAWREDIKDGFAVSDYSRVDPSEGFAEFGRLVLTGDSSLEEIETFWPKAAAVFKERGLWPND